MKKLIGSILILILLLVPFTATNAWWGGYKWRVATTPPTTVMLYDDSPYPLSSTVAWAATQWSNATNVFKINYQHVDNCDRITNGSLWVCSYYIENASSSWVQLYLNGKRNSNLQKAVITLNTWHTIFHEPALSNPVYEETRRYLICHEMGGAIGLQEFSIPYDPNNPDYYHYGCMNLSWDNSSPSQDDIDTLNLIYTPRQ